MGIKNHALRTFSGIAAVFILQMTSLRALGEEITWSTPKDISLPGRDAIDPQVSIAPVGNASVVWSRHNGSNYVVQTATSKIGGEWSSPFRLTKHRYEATHAKIAADANSNTIAVWSRFSGKNIAIQSAYKVSHAYWSDPVYLTAYGPPNHDAANPQIAVDPFGNATVVWQKFDGKTSVIQYSQKKLSRTWSTPIQLSLPSLDTKGDTEPNVAVDSFGNVIVLWLNKSTSTIQGTRILYEGKWSMPVNLSEVGKAISAPIVAIDKEGSAVAIWTAEDDQYTVIQSAVADQKGNWSLPINLSSPGDSVKSPQLAIDNLGNAVVIWEKSLGSTRAIQAARFPEGGSWLSPEDLSDPLAEASEPQVKVDHGGRITAIWKQKIGEDSAIETCSITANDSHWSAPISISEPGFEVFSPQIALNRRGDAVAVWLKSDGKNRIVQASFGQWNRDVLDCQ